MTNKTTTTQQSASTTQVIEVDPRELSSNVHNPREHFRDLDRLTASIKTQGVLQPLVVATCETGGHTILAGHRRAAAAVEADLATVPVVVRDDLADDAAALGVILAENINRDALSTSEETKAVQDLLDLGLSAHKIASRTGLRRKRVQQVASIAAASDDVRRVVAEREATLDEALALSEFSDDPVAVEELSEHLGTPDFAYRAQRARDERLIAARLDEAQRDHEENGTTAYQRHTAPQSHYEDQIGYDRALTAEDHQACGDRYVVLYLNTADGDVRASEHCTNIAQHPRQGDTPKEDRTEEERDAERAARRQVLANNKAMAASNTVRRAWLCELLAAKRPALGKNAPTLLARLYAQNASRIKDLFGWGVALIEQMPDVAWPHGEPDESTPTVLAHAYLFALIAKAIEKPVHQNDDKTVWRDEARVRSSFGDWLRVLAALGYQPSPIEQAIIDGTVSDYTDEG